MMDCNEAANGLREMIRAVCGVFIGKEEAVQRAVLALASGGHVLLEDLPGLGKTLLAKALAQAIDADFKRVQFTADLLPSDITGVTVLAPDRHEFVFRRGPVFTNVLLGDEINRATPRTQSSLLEAMEEQHVTVDGVVYPLEAPFFVLATQNPVELEGTYPLPYAQMDRFMIRLSLGYLERRLEVEMLRRQQERDPLAEMQPVMGCQRLAQIQALVRRVALRDELRGYVVDLVRATRSADVLEYGASPRGSLDVQVYAQAVALLAGRDYVLPDDVKQAARLVLPHRLITRKGTRTATLASHEVVDQLVASVAVPV